MKPRCADLTPPLGVKGGPCKVVDRIRQRVDNVRVQQALIDEVENDRELTNAQSAIIYKPEKERGTHPFDPFVLTPHSQYKMDLRSITVPDLKGSVSKFRQWFFDPKNRRELQTINESGFPRKEFWDGQRTVVFGLRDDPIGVVTTFPSTPDPKTPPEGCPSGLPVRKAGYRAPAGELSGYRTYPGEKPTKGIDEAVGDTIHHPPGESPKSDRERAKPQRTDTKENLERHTPGNAVYNTPGPSGPGQKIHVRTPGTDGEEYGHPFKLNIYPRRTTQAVLTKLFPSYSERQKKQRGKAKVYYRKYYLRHRGKIRGRAKIDYLHKKHSPSFKREKTRRNSVMYGWRFHRLPAGGYHTNADRARDQREKKRTANAPIPYYHPNYGMGYIIDVQDQEVVLRQTDSFGMEPLGVGTVPVFTFLRGAEFNNEQDIDHFFDLVDEDFDREDVVEDGLDEDGQRLATFYRETLSPGYNMDPGDGPQDLGAVSPYAANPALKHYDFDREEREERPSHELDDIYPTDNNPGSAKVIPDGHDFVNHMAARIAAKMSEILQGIDPDIQARARSITPKAKWSDIGHAGYVIYHFTVPGSHGEEYLVRVKGTPLKGARTLSTTDLHISCTCNFWRWQGPEHWAKVDDYLYGEPRGTAVKPDVKDPNGSHRVCKHVVAVLKHIKKWPAFGGR